MTNTNREKLRDHWARHKHLYVGIVLGVALAGITLLIVRRVNAQPIQGADGVLAQGADGVLGKRVDATFGSSVIADTINAETFNNVSYVSVTRQGPPSWVIRCLETGEIFMSQKQAAELMGLPASHISEHLNGAMPHVRGYTFERLCMAVV